MSIKKIIQEAKKKKTYDDLKYYHKAFIGNIPKAEPEEKPANYLVHPDKKETKEDADPSMPKYKQHEEDEVHNKYKRHEALQKHYDFGKPIDQSQDDPWSDRQEDGHDEHRHAIMNYTSSAYSPINKALYNGKDIPDQWQTTHENMKSALKVHQTPEKMFLHSGLKRDPRQLEQHEGQIKMHMPAFTSTSISPDVARSFARELHPDDADGDITHQWERHNVHIEVPQGAHGAYVEHHSSMPGEYEFILHPNSRVHIHPTPEIEPYQNYKGEKGVRFHWHGKLVHDGVKDLNEQISFKNKLLEKATGRKITLD